MTPIRVVHNLPFVVATIRFNQQERTLQNVLVDTGSAATVFKTDILLEMGYEFDRTSRIRNLVGIGGEEAVVETTIEEVQVGSLRVAPMKIQIGALEYGFEMDGLLGLDFLLKTRAIVNLDSLTLGGS
jgi:predicted aspartyl protease